MTPLTALKFAELAVLAGIPAGVINIVTGTVAYLWFTMIIDYLGSGGEIGEALTAHPDVRKIGFTGSTEIGAHVMARYGRYTKRMIDNWLYSAVPNRISRKYHSNWEGNLLWSSSPMLIWIRWGLWEIGESQSIRLPYSTVISSSFSGSPSDVHCSLLQQGRELYRSRKNIRCQVNPRWFHQETCRGDQEGIR